MGLVVHPDFAQTRRFTTCQTHTEGGTADRRPAGHLGSCPPTARAANRVADPLVGGLPINPSGRHSGCRPTLAAGRRAARRHRRHRARQRCRRTSARSAARCCASTWPPAGPRPDNPFADAATRRSGWSATYGHRNVQGVAVRPADRRGLHRRARPDDRRRGEPAAAGRQLRLGPGAGRHRRRLRRVGADDRPGALPRRRARGLELGQPGGGGGRRGVPVRAAVGRPRRHAGRRPRCAGRSCC